MEDIQEHRKIKTRSKSAAKDLSDEEMNDEESETVRPKRGRKVETHLRKSGILKSEDKKQKRGSLSP